MSGSNEEDICYITFEGSNFIPCNLSFSLSFTGNQSDIHSSSSSSSSSPSPSPPSSSSSSSSPLIVPSETSAFAILSGSLLTDFISSPVVEVCLVFYTNCTSDFILIKGKEEKEINSKGNEAQISKSPSSALLLAIFLPLLFLLILVTVVIIICIRCSMLERKVREEDVRRGHFISTENKEEEYLMNNTKLYHHTAIRRGEEFNSSTEDGVDMSIFDILGEEEDGGEEEDYWEYEYEVINLDNRPISSDDSFQHDPTNLPPSTSSFDYITNIVTHLKGANVPVIKSDLTTAYFTSPSPLFSLIHSSEERSKHDPVVWAVELSISVLDILIPLFKTVFPSSSSFPLTHSSSTPTQHSAILPQPTFTVDEMREIIQNINPHTILVDSSSSGALGIALIDGSCIVSSSSSSPNYSLHSSSSSSSAAASSLNAPLSIECSRWRTCNLLKLLSGIDAYDEYSNTSTQKNSEHTIIEDSAIHSISLLLWEIITGCIPYETLPSAHVASAVMDREVECDVGLMEPIDKKLSSLISNTLSSSSSSSSRHSHPSTLVELRSQLLPFLPLFSSLSLPPSQQEETNDNTKSTDSRNK